MADDQQQPKKPEVKSSPLIMSAPPGARQPILTEEELTAETPPVPPSSLAEPEPHRLTGGEAFLLALASALPAVMIAPAAAAAPPPPAQSIVIDTPIGEPQEWQLGADAQDVSQLLSQLEQTATQLPDAPKVTWKDGTLTITLGIGGAALAGATVIWRLTKLVEACMPALVQVLKNRGEREITIEADGKKVTIRGTNDPEAVRKVIDQLSKPHIITS